MAASPSASFVSACSSPPPADDQAAAAASSKISSILGDRDGGTWGFGGWAEDDKVPNCPTCNAPFTMLFRRHHCKNCGGLVCDNCSRGRKLLPQNPSAGKVRVCDKCVDDMAEGQATAVEEELAMNRQVVDSIKAALDQKREEEDTNKVVILEFIKEASGDDSKLQRYIEDPENPDFSFVKLKDLVDEQWSDLLNSLSRVHSKKAAFEVKCNEAQQKLEENKADEEELLKTKAVLDERLGELERTAAEVEVLRCQEAELREGVAQVRRQVQELEMASRERLERQAQQRRRLRLFFGSGGSRRGASPRAAGAAVPFTISTGRQDPLLQGREMGRCESCRRSICTVM